MNTGVGSTVIVLDAFKFRRAGIAALIWSWVASIDAEVVSITPDELRDEPKIYGNPVLVILSVGSLSLHSDQASGWTARIEKVFPHIPSLILSDLTDPSEAVLAAQTGEQGFLSTSVEPQAAIQAIASVVNGGTYFPSEALHLIWGHKSAAGPISHALEELTLRQIEVLEQLQLGRSNKLIGRFLSMQESTVKVHVREIMRKLGAHNRTEAAMLAGRSALQKPNLHVVDGNRPEAIAIAKRRFVSLR